jgi:copper chaperone
VKAYSFEIDGMSCGHCVAAVKEALESVDGVIVENVSIGRARIQASDDQQTLEAVKDAIEDAGYTVTATEAR